MGHLQGPEDDIRVAGGGCTVRVKVKRRVKVRVVREGQVLSLEEDSIILSVEKVQYLEGDQPVTAYRITYLETEG